MIHGGLRIHAYDADMYIHTHTEWTGGMGVHLDVAPLGTDGVGGQVTRGVEFGHHEGACVCACEIDRYRDSVRECVCVEGDANGSQSGVFRRGDWRFKITCMCWVRKPMH